MEKPLTGLELLAKLRENNGKENQNFQDLTQYLSFKAREQGVPFSGQFELTPLCNFACKMCYVHLNPDQMLGHPVLSADTWKNLMYEAWKAGMVKAALSGGECLAYPDFDEVFLYLHSLGCEVAVMTNGFLLTDERISFFQEHMPSSIQITLYGWNDEVYERVTGKPAFTTVCDHIRKAIDAKLPLSICITPSTFLGEDALETVRVAKSLCSRVGINSWLFTPRQETGRSGQNDSADTELYVRIYRLLNDLEGRKNKRIPEEQLPSAGGPLHNCSEYGLKCAAGRSSFVMNWKGTMMPCNRMNMISADPLKEGFAEAWKKINQKANSWPRVSECEGCPYETVCNKCAANILAYGEPGKRPEALCERTRYLVKNGVWYLPDCE